MMRTHAGYLIHTTAQSAAGGMRAATALADDEATTVACVYALNADGTQETFENVAIGRFDAENPEWCFFPTLST